MAKEPPTELTGFFDNNGLGVSTQRIDGKLREWKRLLGNGVTASRPPPAVVSRFKLGLELMEGDVGSSQEVIKRLANDQGLPFVKDVVERHLAVALQMDPSITFWNTEVKPLFQLITHPRVIHSSVLEQEVMTIFNFILGVGGSRMNRLFGYLVLLVTEWPDATDIVSKMSAVELSLAVLSKVLDCNTINIVNQNFATLATQFAEIVATISDEQETFATLQSVKYIDYIRRRLQVGDDIPEMSGPTRDPVAREEFVLRRDLPGTLSAEGPRHDNDFADMSKISILPTCEEIMSPRAEYLPTSDSSQWHIGGIRGRLDREFRLLREDTVGQLRDTVRDVLEHLRRPQEAQTAVKNNLRTYTYENPVPMKVDFRRNGGLELQVRCSQLMAVAKLAKKQREEWWQRSRRLQAGALVCVISASGLVQFFVVSQSTLRSQSEPRFQRPKDKMVSTDEGDQQQVYTLSDDPEYLFVTLQLVEDKVEDVKELLQWYGVSDQHRHRYLVEFPGVLLDSFRHTLAALQQMYKHQDIPFSQILAPASDAGAEVVVQPPGYAREPGFNFDLSCLQDGLLVSLRNLPDSSELATGSTLDATQSAALLNTLSREISLIQGPPGTGKSYTGEKIIQVLLGNKKRAKLGPILCVCYTNHALDQLLEHLLDAGVKGVIRMGSQSKSDRMTNLNLQNIVKRFKKTKEEAAKLGQAEGGIKQVIQAVGCALQELADCKTWGTLKAFLLENYPHQYESIFPPEEDGWIEVTRHKPEQKFERWLCTGDDIDAVPRDIPTLEQSDLWEMNQPERLVLFEYWMKRIRDPIILLISELHEEYSGHIQERSKVSNEVSIRCLGQANVIGLTTTGLAKNIKLLRSLSSKVLLCEEAGEVLEAHILTALLPSLEHAILIGDHLQLRPQINNYELQSTNPCGVQYSLDMSLFERLVIPPHATDPRFPFSSLETQRRMHPSISALIRPTLYPDLNDSEGVHMYPQVVGVKKRLFWMHHEQLEAGASVQDPLNTSHSNDFEVEMTTALVSHLVRQGEYQQGQIAVLTPYLGQLHRLRHRMASIFEISLNERDRDELAALEIDGDVSSTSSPQNASKSSLLKTIRIATVDNFQGEEAEVIVISLVRSNTQNRCGFLSTPNRINVLLSRAKHGMYIIGNSNTYRNVPMWNDVIKIMDAQGNIGTSIPLQCPRHPDTPILVSQPDDFLLYAPESGCNLACQMRLKCGHPCLGRCHSEILHNAVKCREPCPRSMKGCDHQCPQRCGDLCPQMCSFLVKDVNITLPCGHEIKDARCWKVQDPTTIKCEVRVTKTVPGCEHEVVVACWQDVNRENYVCDASCGGHLPCGHDCKQPCFDCNIRTNKIFIRTMHKPCEQICGRGFSTCRHNCGQKCHEGQQCPPCEEPCEVRCGHSQCSRLCHEPCVPCAEGKCQSFCPHAECSMPCAVPCDWVPCSRRCERMLGCGHRCKLSSLMVLYNSLGIRPCIVTFHANRESPIRPIALRRTVSRHQVLSVLCP